jgi:very-short-patch-repair endonuclease
MQFNYCLFCLSCNRIPRHSYGMTPPLLKGDFILFLSMPKKDGLITNFRELPYNPKMKDRARNLRNNSTEGEIKFWSELLRKKQSGYQFYRQKILYHYIVDFYCPKLKLVIEIDGTSHDDKKEYDDHRDRILESFGLTVLHYNDLVVLSNFRLIEKDFKERIKERKTELNFK